MANVETSTAFLFGMEKPLGLRSNPGPHQGVIRVSPRCGSCVC